MVMSILLSCAGKFKPYTFCIADSGQTARSQVLMIVAMMLNVFTVRKVGDQLGEGTNQRGTHDPRATPEE